MLPNDLQRVRTTLGQQLDEISETDVAQIVRKELPLLSDVAAFEAVDQVLTDMNGMGPLEALIKIPGVTDVVVNGPQDVWFDRGNGLEQSSITWRDENDLREFAVRLAQQMNRRLDEVQPFVDVRLKNGIRMHAIIPPLTQNGTCLSFRILKDDLRQLHELQSTGMMNHCSANIIKKILDSGLSFLICGGTGTGKTTLLSAMLHEVSQDQRVVVIEDLYEISIKNPHIINLQVRQPNVEGLGEVTMRSLVRQALRMRPDRLVIGEVRGVEIIDLFTALNTGHQGGCATVHANSAADVTARIEALGLLAGIPLSAVHSLFCSAISLIIEVRNIPGVGRKISGLHLVELNSGKARIEPVYNWLTGEMSEEGIESFETLIRRES